MGCDVRCAGVVVLLFSLSVASASAASPFERPSHAVRELVGERTPESRTWELSSGMRVTQLSTEPVQWRDKQGVWREYDFGLRERPGGWEGSAGDLSLRLPAALGAASDDAVRVDDEDGDWVSIELAGAEASGSVTDGVATYRDALDGVDVHLRVVPLGLKDDLVLRDRAAADGLAYRVTLGSDALSLEPDDVGGLRVMRGERAVFAIPAPTLMDAKLVPGPIGRLRLEQVGERAWRVTPELDDRWLGDKERAWPVMVDPSVVRFMSAPNDDCGISMTLNTDFSWSGPSASCNVGPWRSVGYGDIPGTLGGWWWDLLRFDTLTLVQSDVIDAATLHLYRGVNDPPNAPTIGVQPVSVAWSSSTTFPWQTQPRGWASAPVATIRPGTAGPVDVDLTGTAQDWRRYQTTGGADGAPNRGVILNPVTAELPRPKARNEEEPGGGPAATFTSSTPTGGLPATVLEVRSWPAAPAGNAIISPSEGDLIGKRVKLQARALASSVSTVRFQYVAGTQRSWTDIPLAALRTPTRGTVSSIDVPVSGSTGDRRSDLVVWDLSAMPGGDVDGPVHVRAWLESAVRGDGGMTDQVNFRLDRRGIDGAPSEPLGPGELNLLSGEFSMSQTDASINAFLQNLTLTRTYRSRGVSLRNADMFGSGWDANVQADGGDLPYKGLYDYSLVGDVVVERQALDPSRWNWELFFGTFDYEDLEADIETVQETEQYNYEYAVVETADGTKMTFTQVTDSSGNVTDWTPDDLHPGYTLRRDSTGTAGVFQFTLTDQTGNVAVFLSEEANSPNARLSTFQQPGSTSSLTYTYEASGTRKRLKTVTAPAPAGGPARSLTFNWSNVGTPAVPRVTSVDFRDGYSTTTTVATYSYDSNARLIQVTDPRIASSARNTRYHYNASGQLDQITPSGEATWNLAYTNVVGDTGPRLASVSRAHPDGGTATNTISYGVPLSGGGAPYDMSTAATATWGQDDDLPWDAVAIWPQDTVPDLRAPDYRMATIHYLDLQGLEVNVAKPDGAISTSWHDSNGNVIRDLTAQGRAVALAAGANSVNVAADRSTLYQYAGNGIDLLATREAVTQITLSDGRVVTGRRIKTTNYDENAPGGGPFHLPTSEWRAVEPTSGGQVDVREQGPLRLLRQRRYERLDRTPCHENDR